MKDAEVDKNLSDLKRISESQSLSCLVQVWQGWSSGDPEKYKHVASLPQSSQTQRHGVEVSLQFASQCLAGRYSWPCPEISRVSRVSKRFMLVPLAPMIRRATCKALQSQDVSNFRKLCCDMLRWYAMRATLPTALFLSNQRLPWGRWIPQRKLASMITWEFNTLKGFSRFHRLQQLFSCGKCLNRCLEVLVILNADDEAAGVPVNSQLLQVWSWPPFYLPSPSKALLLALPRRLVCLSTRSILILSSSSVAHSVHAARLLRSGRSQMLLNWPQPFGCFSSPP